MTLDSESTRVDLARIHEIRPGDPGSGPVVYWMDRDMRTEDNWALLYAQDVALELQRPVHVIVVIHPEGLAATHRRTSFQLGGLETLADQLTALRMGLSVSTTSPVAAVSDAVKQLDAAALVTDFSPLRDKQQHLSELSEGLSIPIREVDAHNIVPAGFVSDKREFAAYTIRPKIQKLLPRFLVEFPRLKKQPHSPARSDTAIEPERISRSLSLDRSVAPVSWAEPGRSAARRVMKEFFKTRLSAYSESRNDPNAEVQSDLSPYLNFGHISAQRVALETQLHDRDIKPQEAFLEELIVRRELSDNFCLYAPDYGTFDALPEWARTSLKEHRSDPRQYVYSTEQFETADTHDTLWNAAQLQMVHRGKMHGYMRMYWAKKILEWSPSPEEALVTAVSLNDKYSLDGCDANGYAGISWSIGGLHDRPWFERDIFGKVRYMNANGCARKFDVKQYIADVNGQVSELMA